MANWITRRKFLISSGLAGIALKSPMLFASTQGASSSSPIMRRIPGTDESIPVIGMGTWITFNVGGDAQLVQQRTRVLKTFFDLGGTVVDGSPMYGSAADVMGEALDSLDAHDRILRPPRSGPATNQKPGRRQPVRAGAGVLISSICCRSTICWAGRGILKPSRK